MKILVAIKRVPDYQAKIKVKADGSGIETEGIKWIVNPFCEIAVEEALRLKEAGKATDIIVATIGPADAATQLRYALAMGADSAIHIKHDAAIDSDLASKALAALILKENAQLVILGKQSIDLDANQTPQLLAQRLGWAQACFASKVVLEEGSATVTREVDGGLQTVKIPMPCIISTDLRLNEPRYASLPNIMKAKKKPLAEMTLADLGVTGEAKVVIKKLTAPQARKGGRKVENVTALIQALQQEAKVI